MGVNDSRGGTPERDKESKPASKESQLIHNQNGEQKPPAEKLRLSLTVTNTNESTNNFRETREKSPSSEKDIKEIILSSSKNILGKVLSPSKDKLTQSSNKKIETKKPILMTRRELCDPFGSDDEEENSHILATDNKFMANESKTDLNSDDNKNSENSVECRVTELPIPNTVSVLLYFCYELAFAVWITFAFNFLFNNHLSCYFRFRIVFRNQMLYTFIYF